MPDTSGRCRRHDRHRKTHNAHTITVGVTGIVLLLLGYTGAHPVAVVAGYGAFFTIVGYLVTDAQDRLDALYEVVTSCADCRDLNKYDLDD